MNNLNFGLKQKNYMKHEYAKIWTKMRKNIYAYNSYDKFLFKLIKKKINLKKKKNFRDLLRRWKSLCFKTYIRKIFL